MSLLRCTIHLNGDTVHKILTINCEIVFVFFVLYKCTNRFNQQLHFVKLVWSHSDDLAALTIIPVSHLHIYFPTSITATKAAPPANGNATCNTLAFRQTHLWLISFSHTQPPRWLPRTDQIAACFWMSFSQIINYK